MSSAPDTTPHYDLDYDGLAPAQDDRQTVEAAERGAEDDDLQVGIDGLASLAAGRLNLEELLTSVAVFAVRAIPGAEGAGLTLFEDHRSDTIVCTNPFVREVDDIQYSINQGPCVGAAAEARTVVSGSLGGDPRWPRFGARVARLGVHSAVSVPLITPTGIVGALNVYARAKHAFDQRAADFGEAFAVPAAIAVQNAQVLAQTQRLITRLQHALDTRAVIEQAVGILMSRSGGTEQEALTRLRTLSQRERTKLQVIARNIVHEAVRSADARARHTDQPPT